MSNKNNQLQFEHNDSLCFNEKLNKSELLFNTLILDVIDDNLRGLQHCAQKISHEHQLYQAKYVSSMLEVQGVLELKYRKKKRYFTLEWYQNFDVIMKGIITQIGCALKINTQTLKYSFSNLSWLEDWDKEYAEFIEKKCSMIRKRQEKLLKMRNILVK